MRRINTLNKATDAFGPGKHGWKNGVPGTANRPTEGQAEWFNAVQEELAGVIEAAGLSLDAGDNQQLLSAIKELRGIVRRADFGSDAEFQAARVGRPSIDASNRFQSRTLLLGDEVLGGSALRDGGVVGRDLIGPTDCHGFADRTVIKDVTDEGKYGAFDVTAQVQGDHNHNHLYAYQDRARYAGGAAGVLQNSIGFYSQPIHSGIGRILSRKGIEINSMAVTAGGVIDEQIGLTIGHLDTATNNVALQLLQTAAAGWAVWAPNGGKSYHKGIFGFGMEPTPGVPISFKDPSNALNAAGFLSSDLTRVTLGSQGDVALALVVASQARVVVEVAANNHALRPNGDNTQSLGLASYRWSVLHTGSAPIVASDQRLKDQTQDIDDAVLRAWGRVRWRMYKMRESVAEKGSDARWHFGVIAQQVKQAFEDEGLDPFAYGLLCHDSWQDQYETLPAVFHECIVDADGRPMVLKEAERVLARPAGDAYGIRYAEANALEAAYMRQELAWLRARLG